MTSNLPRQLEDAEFARSAAVKARQSLSQELQETQALLEEAQRARTDTEGRYLTASRELHQLQATVDDQEEETQEVRWLQHTQPRPRLKLQPSQAPAEHLHTRLDTFRSKMIIT